MIVPFLIFGGSEKFNIELIQGLVDRGWEVTVVTTDVSSDPWAPEFTRLTPDVFQMHHFLRRADYPRFLSYLIGSRRPDAVMISNSQLGYQLLPYLRSQHPDLPFVDYNHYIDEGWRRGGFARDSIDHQELLDLKMVNSRNIRDWMVERGGKPPIKVVYIGADTEKWAPRDDVRRAVRREFGINDETPVILYACRIVPEKRPELFAEVLRRLAERGLDFTAWIAGDGRYAPLLKRMLSKFDLDSRATMLGAVPFDRMRELMIAADIFFLPSEIEGIALTVYEAMSTGCAVVAADVGGQKELVTPDAGVLVPRGAEADEISQYVDALEHLLTNRDERRRMASAARERVCSGFSLEDMRDRFVEGIDEAHSAQGRDSRPVLSPHIARSHALFAINETPPEPPEALRKEEPVRQSEPNNVQRIEDRVLSAIGAKSPGASRMLRRLGSRVIKKPARLLIGAYRGSKRRPESIRAPSWGGMRRLEPVSTSLGWDRGTPIDRYWIDRFLDHHRERIRGTVLEVRDRRYTERFGDGRVGQSRIVDIDPRNADADIVADLGEPGSLPADSFDCVILTQILQLVPDPVVALENAWLALKAGGSLLVTHPVITRIDDADGWREYWRATPMGLEELLRRTCTGGEVEVAAFGNLFSGMAFLAGLAAEELTHRELDTTDGRFLVLACGCITKPQR